MNFHLDQLILTVSLKGTRKSLNKYESVVVFHCENTTAVASKPH